MYVSCVAFRPFYALFSHELMIFVALFFGILDFSALLSAFLYRNCFHILLDHCFSTRCSA
jgi:hypothetical protein